MSLWSPEFLSQTIMQQSRRGSAICRRMGKKNINVTALHWKDRGTVIMSGQINIAIGSECAASNNADGNCVRFKFVQGTDTHWRLTAVSWRVSYTLQLWATYGFLCLFELRKEHLLCGIQLLRTLDFKWKGSLEVVTVIWRLSYTGK